MLSAQHCTSLIHSTVCPVSTVFSGTVCTVCLSLGSGRFPVSGLPLGVATAIFLSSDHLRSFQAIWYSFFCFWPVCIHCPRSQRRQGIFFACLDCYKQQCCCGGVVQLMGPHHLGWPSSHVRVTKECRSGVFSWCPRSLPRVSGAGVCAPCCACLCAPRVAGHRAVVRAIWCRPKGAGCERVSGAGAGCVEQACVVPEPTMFWGGASGWPHVWW